MNKLFQNAVRGENTTGIPPIWMMRQAGRYHSHYQTLKRTHSFQELCLAPELAAEVALGPIRDFDFDVAILFSDILFPLIYAGVPIAFEAGGGPKLARALAMDDIKNFAATGDVVGRMMFQKEALKKTRDLLPADKSLIGFIGGLWTLFVFSTQGTHKHGTIVAKSLAAEMWNPFAEKLLSVLVGNIQLQLDGGAEVVMIFDTAAGDLSDLNFQIYCLKPLQFLVERFPGRLGYYGKNLSEHNYARVLETCPTLRGLGVDHRVDIVDVGQKNPRRFIQGNFDQELLSLEHTEFCRELDRYLEHTAFQPNWVCGLGHGVLPTSTEENVRHFVQQVRKFYGSRKVST